MPISSSAKSILFPPKRIKVTVNNKKETNGRDRMGQESRWAAVAYLPERVELTVNSKKETNGRFKMGQ